MKIRILTLTIISIIISCSSDDDNQSSSVIQINPPNWIHGTWLIESSNSGPGYRFTANDFILIQNNIQVSQRQQLEQLLAAGGEVSASDNSTESSYSITLNFPAGQTINYTFNKITESLIQLTNFGITANYEKQ